MYWTIFYVIADWDNKTFGLQNLSANDVNFSLSPSFGQLKLNRVLVIACSDSWFGDLTWLLPNFLATLLAPVTICCSFLLIPFLLELRALMDWMFTDTTLALVSWLQMEDIFANVFCIKCDRNVERVCFAFVKLTFFTYLFYLYNCLFIVQLHVTCGHVKYINREMHMRIRPFTVMMSSHNITYYNFPCTLFVCVIMGLKRKGKHLYYYISYKHVARTPV